MAQDLTCSVLQMVQLKADMIWKSNDKFAQSLTARVDVAKRALEKQTAEKSQFDGANCRKTKVWWPDMCATDVVDNDDSCDFTGEEISTECKEYDFDKPDVKRGFTINDNLCGNEATFEDLVAKGLLRIATDHDNAIEKYVINSLDGMAGVNQYTTDARGDVDGTTTYIKPEYWGTGLMSFLAKTSEVNQIPNACLFSGENMYDVVYNAQANQLNSNQKDQIAKLSAFDWSFDLFNMDSLLGAKKTLMVSPDAYVFDSYHKFKTPTEFTNGADIKRFNFPSPNLPGVTYDVVYRTVCTNGGDDTIHHFKMIARYKMFGAPVSSCNTGQTGIIAFECGTKPVAP
jgi:hypothetical protein